MYVKLFCKEHEFILEEQQHIENDGRKIQLKVFATRCAPISFG